jgi:anti-sigma factor RsiW
MSKCQDLEPLFTAYVDDEAAPPDRAHVDAHLHECPPCRERVVAEQFARDAVRSRRDSLRPCASQALRSRCAAQRAVTAVQRSVASRSRRLWVPVSLAATLFLAASALFILGFNNPVEAFASQMTLDHKGCFFFNSDRSVPDAEIAAREWTASNGWPLKVPGDMPLDGLVLLGVRRCGSTKGRVAHAMYEWHGRPLSVFVLNANVQPAGAAKREIENAAFAKLGERAIIWSRGERTYAVVTKGPMPEIQQVAAHIRQTTE